MRLWASCTPPFDSPLPCPRRRVPHIVEHLCTPRYYQGESLERYFHAFDIEGNGSVDVREFLLGLAASDPSVTSVATHGCEQWERIRLEGIFALYDADADGVIDAKDFSVMVSRNVATGTSLVSHER